MWRFTATKASTGAQGSGGHRDSGRCHGVDVSVGVFAEGFHDTDVLELEHLPIEWNSY
jgi:hypothetical protein